MKICIYPGSFDPVTNGHVDIINRASKLFDKIIVAVLVNSQKNPTFTIEERVLLLKDVLQKYDNIEVESFSGLLVDYAKQKKANVIVKGLRAVSDFENELQMASLNKRLYPKLETVFMMTGINYSFLSSSLVKEIAASQGDIRGLVPESIRKAILKKFIK